MAVTSLSLVTTIPALVSIVIAAVIIYVLIQCVCSKSGASADPELTSAQAKRATVLIPDHHQQPQPAISDTNGVHLEVETGVTPLSASLNSHNGTAHSRGNSADLTIDRHSGASTGSSPRPNAISRLLPDIPIAKTDTLPHPHSQDTKSSTSTLESQNHSRGGHSHSTLPDIPLNQTSALESSVVRRDNPIHTSPLGFRSAVSSPEKNSSIGKMAGKNVSSEIDDQDDYDHIVDNKSKKPRPKSDYDHVKIVGDKTMIVPSKNKLKENDNDYAEVEKDNIYEITEDVTVVPISQPQTSTKPLKKVKSIEDPYNRIKGDDPPYNKIFDPYNKVSDVYDPYDDFKDTESTGTRSSVRNKTKSPMSFRDVTDPYATLCDDERNVSNQTDPYSRVGDTESEIDDPYNKVIEESDTAIPNAGSPIPDYNDNDYATVSKVNDVEYAKVNKPSIRDRHRNSGAVNDLDTGNVSNHSNAGASGSIPPPPSAARTEIIQDEYATVVKIRNFSSSGNGAPQPNGASASSAIPSANGTDQEMVRSGNSEGLSADINTPPEPPRGYALDTGQDTDHYNTVSVDRPGTGAQTSGGGDTSQGSSGKKKEPPYNKLSVRESLASMNARISSNTYEYVSEVDNLYATVEGGSGDGIIRPKSTATETPGRDRESVVSEHYAQIEGASAAPAPPSLDSLHETAKHHLVDVRRKDARPGDLDYYNIPDNNQGQSGVRGHQRTPSGHQIQVQGHNRTLSGQGHSQSQGHFRTPSGDMMTSSFEGRVTLATEEVVDDLDIDPNYQSVQEGQISDLNSEFDPNYETVEEAKSKAKYEEINGARTKDQKLIRNHIYEEADAKSKYEVVNGANKSEDVKIRAHVYEEVTITNEARRTRQRVLNQHTYEEVPNVKDDNQGQSSNQGEGHYKHSGAQGQSVGEVEKRKKGHERTSSSDFGFGKRKSAEVKDKKDKRKSDGKENRKSGEGGKK